MPFMFAIVALVPLGAFAVMRWRRRTEEHWGWTGLRVAALFAVGLTAAAPFLTDRAIGTGEAYNYSLAVADAVTQLRAGEIPVLAGQTEFAFNGRIHPLRNAPYLFYLAGALDLATFRHLSFWELQNLSLALSLIGAIFAAYAGLRWGLDCPRPAAVALASAYGLCPSLLGAAYGQDLYMTVHAAPFVPLALGACLRQCRQTTLRNDMLMAAALAAAWLAHPPVALWLTGATLLVRGLIFLRQPSWRELAGLANAFVIAAFLSGFVFVSVAALSSDLGYFAGNAGLRDSFVTVLLRNVREVFPGCLLPVSSRADRLSDLQFGALQWLLLVATVVGLGRSAFRPGGRRRPRPVDAGLLVCTLFLLCLTLPIPGVTGWLWLHLPSAVHTLTNIWPMQRLYLVATALVIFGAALVTPCRLPRTKPARSGMIFLVALGVAALFWQARPFIVRGFATRWEKEATTRSHLASNIDLTIASYAFLGVPPSYRRSVIDPRFEFALQKHGKEIIAAPMQGALMEASVVAQGELPASPAGVATAQFTLEPHRQYLLSLAFRTPPRQVVLILGGTALARLYSLPDADEPSGTGAAPSHRYTFPLWTALEQPEKVTLELHVPDWAPSSGASVEPAGFILQAVDTARLPVRVESLLPLRCTVETDEDGCYVETCRRYLPGYRATVNGRPVRPIRSPAGQVMLPVPRGKSEVELSYAGTPAVRVTFWLNAIAWLGFFIWAAGHATGFSCAENLRPLIRAWTPLLVWLKRHRWWLLGTAAVIAAGASVWHFRSAYLQAIGPVRITLLLPRDQPGRRQPVLATGRTGAGTIVFLEYHDEQHVRVGAEIWGKLYESDPLPVDYWQEQEIVVSSSALYPLDHPRVRALSPLTLARRRGELRVELNGRTALLVPRPAFESRITEVTIGETRIGGSNTDARFSGTILKVGRLPPAPALVLFPPQSVNLKLCFPADREGLSEPLLSLGPAGRDGLYYVSYLSRDRLRFGFVATDGTKTESPVLPFAAGREEVLTVGISRQTAGSPALAADLEFRGRHLFDLKLPAILDQPFEITAGFNASGLPGIEARFTGPTLAVVPPAAAFDSRPAQTFGPIRLTVFFPQDKTGQQEPLVVTGRPGAGDFAYVIYADARHVRFGFDHWAVGGAVSEPIPIDYDSPQELEISMGSLYPATLDADGWNGLSTETRQRCQLHRTIRLNGRIVFQADLPCYPADTAGITVGHNRIGGSTCGPEFSGIIYSEERRGSVP
ncbi:MAG: hypothetical protein PHE83_01975 [Opitutaceae bacterium]|nr:hypothetical protein [Opitutaceae bacterium]